MPILNLTIAGQHGGAAVPQTQRLETGRMTIGRGDECDWQLPDAERDVSRVHCLIERVGDGYTITDLSTNGVFLNGATEPLGHNISAPLADRDEIVIGHYRIQVGIEGATAPAAGTDFAWFSADGPAIEPFPGPPTGYGGPIPGPMPGSAVEPFPGWPEEPERLPGLGRDPFGGGSGAAVPPLPSPDGFPGWPDIGQSPVPPEGAAASNLTDPFGWPLSGPVEPAPMPPFPSEMTGEIGPNRTHERDTAGALNTYMPAPELQPSQRPPGGPPGIASGWAAPGNAGTSPTRPQTGSPIGSDRARAVPKPARPAAVPPSVPATARAGTAGPSEALAAFLEGLGLHDLTLPPGDELARLRGLGALFRELASGLRDLLNARAMTKASFQVAPTMIAARNNNPFKFSVDLDQLLKALLAPGRHAYAEPLAAVAEAVADLKAHDLALIASTQQAVRAVLDDLSPASISRSVNDPGVLGKVLPAARKAAWWDAYEAAYRQQIDGVESDMQDGFLRSFAEAYAEEVKKS